MTSSEPVSLWNQPRSRMSATAKPKGSSRVLSTSPATTAATGPPPASTTATALNCAPPAKISRDMVMGTQVGRPPATEMAPKEMPTMAVGEADQGDVSNGGKRDRSP